ncbi:MAG: cytochrome P450 [Pseudomonadota bacterium]
MAKELESSALPQGVSLTALDAAFREDPYPILARLREQAPVHEDRELGRFIVTRHDDVKALLRDKALYTDPRKGNPGTFARDILAAALVGEEEPSMLLMDEPEHRRLRTLVSAPFRPAAVERWRDHIRNIIQGVLARIDEPEFELIERFAGPVPTVVIAEMLGIEVSQHDRFKQWSDQLIALSFNPFPTEEQTATGEAATEALDNFFLREIDRRRRQPGDDLLSEMLRAEEDGETLSEDDIVLQCERLLIAGNVTTCDLIGNAVHALLENPKQMDALRHDPSLINNAIEEVLRFDSPVTNSGRITNRSMTVSGCPISQGESLSTSLAAANRDPEVYPQPDMFDIHREDTHHQAFGGGRHLCLGAHLARVEAQEAILGLLNRFPTLEQSERGQTRHAIPSFRGFSEYWVKGC